MTQSAQHKGDTARGRFATFLLRSRLGCPGVHIRIKSAILWLRTYHYFLDTLQNEIELFSIAVIAGLLLTL